ncbi:hypothetical protein [Sphingomonas faeni]|uniref:hypothetical protein n=1 Tax=Sphingomonas faeni TaxID=185950 RepID=UPI00335F6EF1
MSQPALAQAPAVATSIGTPAGTPIVNTAGLRYDADGTAQSTSSNTVTIIVAERLDVALVRDGRGAVVVTAQPVAIPFTLTNLDNGTESFVLAASVSPGAAVLRTLVIDTDGDGLYDPAKDVAPVDGKTPLLSPGQSLKLLAILVATPEGGAANAVLTVTARSTTGSGATGNVYPSAGDGGGDAVVGPTGALATVSVPLGTALAGPVLLKSQSVRAADGSQTAVRDAVITYTLEARFTDAVSGARIADPIPVGTVFVPGSLTLDGAPLSDGADDDAGRFDPSTAQGAGVTVALGRVAAGSSHTVQFKAKIQ